MKLYCLLASLLLWCMTGTSQVYPYTATAYDTSSRGYYFLTTNQNVILDSAGDVVYYQLMPKQQLCYDFKVQPNGLMSYYTGSKYYLMDSKFTLVDSVICKNGYSTDLHDLQILPNGNFLLMGNEFVTMDLSSYPYFRGNGTYGSKTAQVMSGIVQEQDPDKNVVFQWRTRDHFLFSEVDSFWLNSPINVDWTHFNAIALDKDNNILVSSRHFNEIIKIDHNNGNVLWRLGGKHSDFSFLNNIFPFHGQHDIRRISNGSYTLFDGGAYATPHGARALEYQLDAVNKTARLKWSYMYDSAMFSSSQGNVQRLANGNTLVNFGVLNQNKVCFVVVDSLGHKVFELVFKDPHISYRVFNYLKLPWNLDRPQLRRFDSAGVTYLDAGAGYSSYLWNDGSTSRMRPLVYSGDYYAFVPHGKGFISTIKLHVTDKPCPASPINGKDSFCNGSSITFSAPGNPGSKYTWTVSGATLISGQNTSSIIVSFPTAGNVQIRLIQAFSGGCVDTVIKKVTVFSKPLLQPSGRNKLCAGESAGYSTTKHTGSVYSWRVSGGSILQGQNTDSITVHWSSAISGKVTVSETATGGCADSSSLPVTVSSVPTADFDFKNVCAGDSTFFQYKGSGAATYSWNFGESQSSANTSSLTAPGHQFKEPGIYQVSLLVRSGGGCADSVTKTLTIHALPDPHWRATITGQSLLFKADDSLQSVYGWDFGDGSSGTGFKSAHEFDEGGSYKVHLTVKTKDGCEASFDSTVNAPGDLHVNGSGKPLTFFEVYPSPAGQNFNIAYRTYHSGPVRLSLFDLHGRELVLSEKDEAGSECIKAYDAQALKLLPGLYIVRLSSAAGVYNRSLIIH